jgi:hypothetical protein
MIAYRACLADVGASSARFADVIADVRNLSR